MSENLIEMTLKSHILEKNAVFVFPTQMAADLWADRATLISGVSAVPMEKFIPWDDFKSEAVRSENQERNTIPSIMRKVFAENIIEENRNSPFLKNLILPKYAKNSGSFTSFIAGILPSLGLWHEYFVKNPTQKDDEDADLLMLFEKYSAFMDKHNLFDPAWERPPFKNNGNHYYLFFPEIFSDWAEYQSILQASSDFITVINVPEEKIEKQVKFFGNSRIEIKNVASQLWKIKEGNNLSWSEIAVSVPKMEVYGPYIERELDLMEIPHVSKYSKPVTKTGAGGFFVQVQECIEKDFNYDSLKALLLNNELPWKDKENCERLLEYGRKNNCICSFDYDGKFVDVWEKSFEENEDKICENLYKFLKIRLNSFKNAKNFSEIREAYFSFTSAFFDMENCSEKSDKILGVCIAGLSEIIDIEEEFDKCNLQNPYGFFVEMLNSKQYLEQLSTGGVVILPYKTSCCAPFAWQIVVDSSQQSLGVIFKELSFLNEEKRVKLLNREESNVSEAVIQLYCMNSTKVPVYFTCAKKTFDGYSQTASYLSEVDLTEETEEKVLYGENPYNDERNWIYDETFETAFPEKITETEKISFDNWIKQLQKNEHQENADLIVKQLSNEKNLRKDGSFEVSATSMKNFYDCPRKWAFQKLLYLEERENAGELTSPFTVGNIKHKVMEIFCKKLKENDFLIEYDYEKQEIPEKFVPFINDAVRYAINYSGSDEFKSFLTKELLRTAEDNLKKQMFTSISEFCKTFAGCKVVSTEGKYDSVYGDGVKITGKIDCLLQDNTNTQYFLVDYKNSEYSIPKNLYVEDSIPEGKAQENADESESGESSEIPSDENSQNKSLEEEKLPDFQMPTYIHLLGTQNKQIKVENACFFNFKKSEVVPVLGAKMFLRVPQKKNSKKERFEPNYDDFLETMQKFDDGVNNFALRTKNGDYKINGDVQNYTKCTSCDFKTICRKTFNVGKQTSVEDN